MPSHVQSPPAELEKIYELAKQPHPPFTGAESMRRTCAEFFTDAHEFTSGAEQVDEELKSRKLARETGKRERGRVTAIAPMQTEV